MSRCDQTPWAPLDRSPTNPPELPRPPGNWQPVARGREPWPEIPRPPGPWLERDYGDFDYTVWDAGATVWDAGLTVWDLDPGNPWSPACHG